MGFRAIKGVAGWLSLGAGMWLAGRVAIGQANPGPTVLAVCIAFAIALLLLKTASKAAVSSGHLALLSGGWGLTAFFALQGASVSAVIFGALINASLTAVYFYPCFLKTTALFLLAIPAILAWLIAAIAVLFRYETSVYLGSEIAKPFMALGAVLSLLVFGFALVPKRRAGKRAR